MPQNVKAALARAKERDDRAKWQQALHQDFRDEKRVARTNAQAKAYDDYRKAFDGKIDKELKRRGLKLKDIKIGVRS